MGVNSREVKVDTEIDLSNNLLSIEDIDLDFSDLSGVLNFSNESGFYAENLKAKLFNRSIKGSARTDNFGGSRTVLLNMEGSVGSDDAYEWTGQPFVQDLGRVKLRFEFIFSFR